MGSRERYPMMRIFLLFIVASCPTLGFVHTPKTALQTSFTSQFITELKIRKHINRPQPYLPYSHGLSATSNNDQLRVDDSNDSQNDSTTVPDAISSTWIFAGIPILSLTLTFLLQAKLIGPLLIAKRVYIYLMAATIVTIASLRGASDSPSLGNRLIYLTREILPNTDLDNILKDNTDNNTDDTRFQEMAVLNDVDDSTQALGLPLLVVTSLVISLFFVSLQNTNLDIPQSTAVNNSLQPILEAVKSFLPQFITLSNGFVISLFARSEFIRLPTPLQSAQKETVAVAGALSLTALAYWAPSSFVWPIQNLLCMCLAVSVARAIQLPRLGPILLALSGLVLYDVASVGIQLVNLGTATLATSSATAGDPAATTAAAAAATASSSAMGTVAMAKAGAASWQPGLLQVKLRGVTTDLLGLGDAVFPALLSTFCRRFDIDSAKDSSSQLFPASLVGFVMGCLACEFAPGISDTGLPALLFIVPSMMISVLGLALIQGKLASFWSFQPQTDESDSGMFS